RGAPTDPVSVTGSDGLFRMRDVPKSMVVVGGGVIGVEYACMFSTLGVAVTVVDARHRLLEFLDSEIVDALVYHMRSAGVTFRLGEVVERVECLDSGGVVAPPARPKQIHPQNLVYA